MRPTRVSPPPSAETARDLIADSAPVSPAIRLAAENALMRAAVAHIIADSRNTVCVINGSPAERELARNDFFATRNTYRAALAVARAAGSDI